MVGMSRCLFFLVLCSTAAWPQTESAALTRLTVEGLATLPAGAVLHVTGLTEGQAVGQADLEGACGRLLATGLFSDCRFRFNAGLAAFQVSEAETSQAIGLDLPGVTGKDLWEWAGSHEPLLRPRMPGNADAAKLYTAAIQRFVDERIPGEKVTARLESRFGSNESELVFRPAHPPMVGAVAFTGALAVAPGALAAVMQKPAIGAEYTENSFRQLLDLNARPLYEEQGRLSVSFPRLETTREAANRVAVRVSVNEGEVYRLRTARVTVDGAPGEAAGLPVGGAANWKLVTAAVDRKVVELRNGGYLDARGKATRRLDEQQHTVDATVEIYQGVRYVFGKLTLKGLTPELEEQVAALWTVREGQPALANLPAEFVELVFKQLPAAAELRSATVQPHVRPNTNIVDYTVNFR